MKEAAVGREQPVITHGESAEVAEPREGAFHDPAPTIPTQTAAVLIRRPRIVRAGRNDRLNVPVLEPPPQAVAVIAAIGDQPVRIRPRPPRPMGPGDFDRGEGLIEERDLRRGRRVQVCSQRSTCAIDQYHPLRSLAALGFADFGAPFLAGAKLPSTKHSSQRIFWRSLSWLRKARPSRGSRECPRNSPAGRPGAALRAGGASHEAAAVESAPTARR